MKSVVLIKQVPLSADIGVDEETGVIMRESGATKMNPYDLFALETALRFRETIGGSVTVLTMGPPQAEQVVREAFMMGVDHGFLLSDRAFAGSDVLATSLALSQALTLIGNNTGGYDMILCGQQTTDGDTAQVGAECSEFLNIPCVTNVKKIIRLQSDAIMLETDMGMTMECVRINFPCLIAVNKDIFQPRLPSYLKKKETITRPVKRIKLKDLQNQDEKLYGLNGSPTNVIKIFPPAINRGHEVWKGENLGHRLYKLLKSEKHLQEHV